MDFKTMLQLPVLDTNEVLKILQEIADIERKKEKPQMLQVTISTHSGGASGFFVNYDSEKFGLTGIISPLLIVISPLTTNINE